MPTLVHAHAGDLAKALREHAPPAELARIVAGKEPARAPVPFRIITDALTADTRDWSATNPAYAGRPVLQGTHSSTNTQDLHGTWWTPSALESMRQSALDRMTIFLNHEYQVPESIMGTVIGAEINRRTDERAGTQHLDLDLATLVVGDDVNPRAMQCYRAITRDGVRLGNSVGVIITDWEWQDPDGRRLADVETSPFGPEPYDGDELDARLAITDVLMIESSTVGIPSNRRSWAREADRALRRAGVLPARPPKRPSKTYSIPETVGDAPAIAESQADAPDELPVATRCTQCGCACQLGAPEAGCDCDCDDCQEARASAPAPGRAAVSDDGATDAGGDRSFINDGRSLDDLDAAWEAAGGIVRGADEPDDEPEPVTIAEAPAVPKQPKQKRAVAAPETAPTIPAPPAPALDVAELAAVRADIERATALRDNLMLAVEALSKRQKRMRKELKRAAAVIEAADSRGLYRPTRITAARAVDLQAGDLIALDDDQLMASLGAGLPR